MSVIVSLQDGPPAPSGAEQHLCFGELFGTDLAVFALPPEVELAADRTLHVLVAPSEAVDTDVIERFPPWHVEVASVAEAEDQRVCVVRLAHRSQYATTVPELGEAELLEKLQGGLGLVDSLHELGVVLPRENAAPLLEALTRVLELESAQAVNRVRVVHGRTPEEVVRCVLSPKCNPESPTAEQRPRRWSLRGDDVDRWR